MTTVTTTTTTTTRTRTKTTADDDDDDDDDHGPIRAKISLAHGRAIALGAMSPRTVAHAHVLRIVVSQRARHNRLEERRRWTTTNIKEEEERKDGGRERPEKPSDFAR